MFPESLRVIPLRRHQFAFSAEVKAAGVQQPGQNRRSRAMRAGDANHRLGVSAIFHSKRLNNDEPPSASSRLVTTVHRWSVASTALLLHSVKSSSRKSQVQSKFPSDAAK